MTCQRNFPLEEILSVTTGRLELSPRHMGAFYDILNHMTGEVVHSHDLPRATAACRPAILRQHPPLIGLKPPAGRDLAVLQTWVNQMKCQHGSHLHLTPLAPGVWRSRDPLPEFTPRRPTPHPGRRVE